MPMCGISGIIQKDGFEPSVGKVKSMSSALHHRGPDDQGIFSDGCLTFAHNRLSILDLSRDGHQPMTSLVGNTVIFNGEIYNYLELKEELAQAGFIFHSKSDTEVLLAAYERWGIDCLSHFNGMWAFALYDKKRGIVFMSRDRFGIKPFYYSNGQKEFLISSEIKGIFKVRREVRANMDVISKYLVSGNSDDSQQTFFDGVYQLAPGQYALYDLKSHSFRTYLYYDVNPSEGKFSTSQSYLECFENSIRIHLRSDVPIGTCLSGGLDSSSVAALAIKWLKRTSLNYDFQSVTAQSEFAASDETVYAQKVVDYCGLRAHFTKPSYSDFRANVEKCLYHQDEPVFSPSVFMQYWVMKVAKEAGIKVMLDGQGGDESLLGYERYYPAFFWGLLKGGRMGTLLREVCLSTRHSKLKWVRMGKTTTYFLFKNLRKNYMSKRVYFLKPELVSHALTFLDSADSSFFDLQKLQRADIKNNNLPQLLRYEDRNSMAHSIEARVPFVEYHCIESALSLPMDEKIKNGFTKYPLRLLAEKVLPPEIAWRVNKIGFEAPNGLWLGQHMSVLIEKIQGSPLIRHMCTSLPKIHSLEMGVLWRLYNLAVWEAQFNVTH